MYYNEGTLNIMNTYVIETKTKKRKQKPTNIRHLKMSSAAVVCCMYFLTLLNNVSIDANGVDPYQTAPPEAVSSGSPLFVKKLLNISKDDKSRRLLL